MKNILISAAFFLVGYSIFAQNNTFKFTYMGNDIEIKMERNDVDDFDVHITNLTNDNISKKVILPNDTAVSSFIETIHSKLDGLIKNYKFIINNDLTITLPKDTIAYDNFLDAMQTLPQEEFLKLIKTKIVYIKSKVSFSEYISEISKEGDKDLFENSKLFLFKSKKNAENSSVGIKLFKNEEEIIDVSDEATFYKDFYEKENADDELMKLFLTTEEHAAMIKAGFKVNDRVNLEDFLKKNKGEDDYDFIKNVVATGKNYEVSVKPNIRKNFFNIRVCNTAIPTCSTTHKMEFKIEYADFKSQFTGYLLTKHSESGFTDYDYRLIYDYCKKFNEDAITKEVSKKFNDSISTLLKKIENLEPQYSGILKLNKEGVRIYKITSRIFKNDSIGLDEDAVFVPNYATVRFFNNKAKDIEVIGTLKHKESKKNREFVTRNIRHSIPLRGFINSTQYVKISPNDDDADGYFLNYNDLFHYYPSERTFNFSVRNNDYRIKAGDSVKVEQRRLADYFTAVIFSDFLGLNSENANSLLLAEGRLKVPLWISNVSIWSAFSALRADINATIYNGFDDSSRFMTPVNAPNGVSPNELSTLEINIFDYIKYNNINAGIGLDFLNIELKPLSTEWSFGYGVRYYRAGARYMIQKADADEERKYQLNALTHEISTNFEIRPELNFGADINLGFNWLNARGSLKNIPIVYSKNSNMDDKSVVRIQLNLYSKIDPRNSNDGIYARLGGFYHLGSKDFYPQIMVGYATNLSSFVNKFKKD